MKDRVAVIIPCYNEATTIGSVIEGFRSVLPRADIYVGDNNCTDGTVRIATEHGAYVVRESAQGKGAMFASLMQSIEADIFVFVDGDGTYDPRSSREAIWRLQKNDLDCVFVNRKKQALWHQKQYGRFLGNVLFYALFRLFTRLSLQDPLTGYRVFTKKFIQDYGFVSSDFTVETELNLHLAKGKYSYVQMWSSYRERPTGSLSKLRIFRDGFRILGFLILHGPLARFRKSTVTSEVVTLVNGTCVSS